ncbi:xanthine dehydrogenase accessory factor [Aliiroseovarius sediminilitoris]|uniref:Xanthine dehydrogenase accessory factor n=1 Tax=Aliiroseovarius sediminilitoris TaxID=1173584 RepID=A0A1I0QH14_9RHOB|nr:xanthine dehydrogenase accessory factor [Aliiroseovarius sediminilitoris]
MATLRTLPDTALDWLRAGQRVAIATVVQTWGSAPCPAGSQMIIAEDGDIEGSVSGGCVEGAVVTEALEAIGARVPRLLTYSVADEDAFSAGLACGGTIRVLVEPVTDQDNDGAAMPVAMLAEIVRTQAHRVPIAYQVNVTTWARQLTVSDTDTPQTMAGETRFDGDVFTLVVNPSPRLVIVGAVHIAQNLAPMAAATGFDPIITDPRSSFATPARFPGLRVICDDTDAALAQIGVDAQTAIVTLGHDPKIDDPAIREGLGAGSFYIGCLGSRRTHAARLDRLRALGLPEDALSRLHGPVGLDIGAKGPAEIAVSILSQLVAARRGRL